MPSPNILDLSKARQDLPLPDSRIGAFEPSLYGKIIHAALTLLACVIEKMSPKKKGGISNNDKNNKNNK